MVYATAKALSLWALWLFFGFRRYGRRNVPKRGALLLVANHQSYLDPPIVGVCLRRQFHPIARAGLFESAHFAWLIRQLNAIPIREDSRGDTAAMKRALELLGQGEIVLLFPEGTRTQTGEVDEFKRGAGLLIKRAQCPVAPVAIDGAFEAWPRTRKRPRLFQRIRVKIGEPIPHDELLTDGADAALVQLREEVVRLLEELRAMHGGRRGQGAAGK